MKHRSSLVQTALSALGLATLLLGACGGRYQTVRESADDTPSGSSGRAGAPSVGRGGAGSSLAGSSTGGVGIGGSSNAGASSAGTSGAAVSSGGTSGSAGSGGGDCRFAKCMGIVCLGGQERITEPGQCCATKCSACPPCPMLKCPGGYHLETATSDCCPHCSPDGNVGLCLKGQQEYAMQRSVMVDKYSYGCTSSSECVVVATVNSCEPSCSYAVIWTGAANSLESNLSNLADANCSSCKQGPLPACEPVPPPSCFNGRCSQ